MTGESLTIHPEAPQGGWIISEANHIQLPKRDGGGGEGGEALQSCCPCGSVTEHLGVV